MSEFFQLPKEIGASEDIRILKAGKKNHEGKFGPVSFFDVEHNGNEMAYSVKTGSSTERLCDDNIGGTLRVTAYFDEEKGQRRYKWETLEGGKPIGKPMTSENGNGNGNGHSTTNGNGKPGCEISIDDAIALATYMDQQLKMNKVAVGVSSHVIDKIFGNLCFNHSFKTDREFLDYISQPDANIPFED